MTDTLRAGTARVTITPPVGVHLQGYNRGKPSEGIRDELHARALVLEQGGTRAALVCADLIGLEPDSVARIRSMVEERTGIPGEAVCLATSHTHSGPAVAFVAQIDLPDPDVTRTIEKMLAGVVTLAARETRPVRVGHGEGHCGFNINRRLPTPNGIVMRPNPEGVQDRRVQIVRLDGEDGLPMAVLFRYACHPTCLSGQNLRLSGDYPGAAARVIERVYSSGTRAFFLPGCFGDLRPNLTTPQGDFRGATDAEVDRLGRMLGAEVVRVAEELAVGPDHGLAIAREELPLPYEGLPSVDDLRRALREAEMEAFDAGILERHARGEARVEVQALRLGPLTLVALPGEVMNEIGRAIEASLDGPSLVMAYTNANPGYLCTASAMAEGGYEPTCYMTSYHHPAPFPPDTEHRLRRAALAAAARLTAA
jgi:neutral ceramidase